MSEPLVRRLAILAEAARYDASCASSGAKRARVAGGVGDSDGRGICHSFTPDGRCVSLLKLLLTNHCSYDCAYCVNRAASATERARLEPDEVVALTMDFYRRNLIDGLFLSSGIVGGPDETFARLVEVARRLREEHRFGGYIHLKAPAGVSRELLFEGGGWADRISANIELPRADDLARLAPAKTHAATEKTMRDLAEGIAVDAERSAETAAPRRFVQAGQSTQMIVGATPASDGELLTTAARLYRGYGLKRVYYSAFSPIPHADPALPPTAPPLEREHRLYQADWLMRFYGFDARELVDARGALPLARDPKLDWALRHRGFFPVDVNAAPREALLRVPGFGVRTVERILAIRPLHALTLADLAALHVPLRKARDFVCTVDHRPRTASLDRLDLGERLAQPRQLELFTAATTARTGQL